jgi:hypothetical protein
MAWTTPKTWATSDLTTAALFNTHIKDNLAHLKTPFDDSGKLAALSSSYVASLEGTNGIHGLSPLAGTPPWTDVTGYSLSNGVPTKTGANGWDNSGARSTTWRAVGEATKLRYAVRTADHDMFVGLTFDFGNVYAAIDYSFNIGTSGIANNLFVYENGVVKNTSTVVNGDILTIDVSAAGVVKYYNGTTLLYTSLTSATQVLYAVIMAYSNGFAYGDLQWSHANLYTAGQNNFNSGTARLVIPVGTDKYDGWSGAKTPGSLWVEGDYLHWISSTNVEWRFLGRVVSTPAGAIVGSIWTEGTGTGSNLSYIDASGVERAIDSSSAPHTDGATVAGSIWVDTSYVHWSPGSGVEYQAHVDTHSDGTTHSDVSHTDTHTDTHGDVAHDDVAAYHGDYHVDHTDVGHADVHTDTSGPHTDVPYTDTYSDSHSDVSHADHSDHGDVAHDDRPENMGT